MAGRSSLESLPPETLAVVHEAIREGATIDEIVRRMRAHGGTCSRSAVTRYVRDKRDYLQRRREAEDHVDFWLGTLADCPEGRTGWLALETLRTLAMQAAKDLEEGKEPRGIEEIGTLALAMRRIESAGKSGADRESVAARNPARQAAGRRDRTTLPKRGLSPETVAIMRAAIMGPPGDWKKKIPGADGE